jgi:hypothetical protein
MIITIMGMITGTITITAITTITTIITIMVTNTIRAFICRVGKAARLGRVPTRRRLSQPSRQTLSTDRGPRVTRGHGTHIPAKTGVNALLLRAFAHPTEDTFRGASQ